MYNNNINLLCPQKIDGFPEGENMIRTMGMSHKTEISWAFFKIPALLFPYVTCRLFRVSNLCIFSFTLPILQFFSQIIPILILPLLIHCKARKNKIKSVRTTLM